MIKSGKAALANHFGWDIAEVDDHIYQRGMFSKNVYTVGNSYYCVTKTTPAKSRDINGTKFDWKEVKDDFINRDGWKIFVDNSNEK
jgi:hypothetical protein